jgi:NAD(P)-dependent dehydrogenase (short-subunit alcohol dehydrogenase family)
MSIHGAVCRIGAAEVGGAHGWHHQGKCLIIVIRPPQRGHHGRLSDTSSCSGYSVGGGTASSLRAGARLTDPLHAYQLSKRGNSLRVMAEAVRWGKRGARVNTISPGIIITPLANDELSGPRGAGYRNVIALSPAGRAGTPDEVGTVGALLMGSDRAFITGSDFLMDGGVTASYLYGELAPG